MLRKKGEGISNNNFNLSLIISLYLVVDVIILFCLCLIELNGTSHLVVLSISFLIEMLVTILIIVKSNIRSAVIFYILLLVSPIFMNLVAMAMHYITEAMPFVPTVLLLFRSGYDLSGNLLNGFMRFVISFRLPTLLVIVTALLIHLIKDKKKKIISNNVPKESM